MCCILEYHCMQNIDWIRCLFVYFNQFVQNNAEKKRKKQKNAKKKKKTITQLPSMNENINVTQKSPQDQVRVCL